MGWTIRYKNRDGREAESQHEFVNEEAAIKYAHEIQWSPNWATIVEIINPKGHRIKDKELEMLLTNAIKR